MPSISTKAPPWTAADAEQLRAFLDGPTGARLSSVLLYLRPEYGAFKSIEERAVKSGEVDGYEKCLLALDSARNPDLLKPRS